MTQSRRSFLDRFFGYDYFIAHRRSDGRVYARALHDKLTGLVNPFRCFIDLRDFHLGGDLTRMQTVALRKSARLIVVVTPEAHASPKEGQDWLLSEVREFKAVHGDHAVIVPIGTPRTLARANWPDSKLLEEIPHLPNGNCILEPEDSTLVREPSEETLTRLILDFTERKQETNRLRLFQGLALGLAIMLVVAVGLGLMARFQQQLAEKNEKRMRVSKAAAEGIVEGMLRDLGQKLEEVGKLELLEDVAHTAEDYFVRMDPELRDRDTEVHAALSALIRGDILRQKGDHAAARERYASAEQQLERLVQRDAGDALAWRDLGAARGSLGLLAKLNDEDETARAWVDKSVAALEKAVSLAPGNPDFRREVLVRRVQQLEGRSAADGVASATEWDLLVEQSRKLAEEHPGTMNIRLLSFLHGCAADADVRRGDLDKASARYRDATVLMIKIEKLLPEDASVQLDLADSFMQLGLFEKTRKRSKEALDALGVTIDIVRSMRERDPANQEWLGMHAQVLSVYADTLFAAGDREKALAAGRDATRLLKGIRQRHPATRKHARDAALALSTFGMQLAHVGEWEGATESWTAAAEMLERLAEQQSLTPAQEVNLAITQRSLVEAALAKTPPDLVGARKLLDAALERLRRMRTAGRLPESAVEFIEKWESRRRDLQE